jgi:hypothetical protein
MGPPVSGSNSQQTLLGTLFPSSLSERPGRRPVQLTVEGVLSTLVSTYVPVTLGVEEAGLVSLFLVAAALSDRVAQLLEENRRNIWERGMGGWQANRSTAGGVLALFAGVFSGYALIAYVLDETRVIGQFGFALRAAALGGENLLQRDFGTFSSILGHNAGVLLVIACLSFVYRAYGTMLALAWNASIWALVITVLAMRTAHDSGLPAFASVTLAVLALAPHLLLEGLAYITASLAFLFASKGLTTYTGHDPRLRRVLVAAAALTVAAAVTLAVAAMVEVSLGPLALSLL